MGETGHPPQADRINGRYHYDWDCLCRISRRRDSWRRRSHEEVYLGIDQLRCKPRQPSVVVLRKTIIYRDALPLRPAEFVQSAAECFKNPCRVFRRARGEIADLRGGRRRLSTKREWPC